MSNTAEHLYAVGQDVNLEASASVIRYPSRPFRIVAKLPPSGAGFQYRIKSIDEIYERMVFEHQLAAISLQ